MVDFIEYKQKDVWKEYDKLKKDVKFLKILILFFGVDLCILTYAVLKLGGMI